MGNRLLIDALKVLVGFLLLLGLFTYYAPFSSTPSIEVPVEYEEELGDLVVEQLFEKNQVYEEVEDSTLERAMRRIEGRLVREVGLTEFEHDIRVVRSEQVNAFTLPGGHILVCSGLIEFSEDPEEVAAVVAHEIGHVEERHVMQRLVREFGKAVLMTIVGDPGGGRVLGEIGSSSLSATFDREQEKEADDYALELMEKSGIPPDYLGSMFRRMKEEKYSGEGIPTILKSHPELNSRIKKAFEYETGPRFEERSFDLDWEVVKESLKKGAA